MHSDNSERKNQIQERVLTPIDSFRSTPLRVQFIVTSLPVGGAEILLRDLVSNFDRTRIEPEVVCLKEAGALGDEFASHVPVHSNFLKNKWDLRVFSRLTRHFRASSADAVVTVGAGDKMFWGRLAAARAKVPVICSAVHSTGWPDGIGLLNKLLTPMTAGFIACAENHAHYLIRGEGLPEAREPSAHRGLQGTGRHLPDVSPGCRDPRPRRRHRLHRIAQPEQ